MWGFPGLCAFDLLVFPSLKGGNKIQKLDQVGLVEKALRDFNNNMI